MLFEGALKKVIDDRGETIAETLVSVLISALALLLLSTAIGTAVSIVSSSRDSLERHYEAESELVRGTISLNASPNPLEASSVEFQVSPYPSITNMNVIAYKSTDENIYRYVRDVSP